MDEVLLEVAGRFVRDGGSELTVTHTEQPSHTFRLVGDRVLAHSSGGPTEGCWIDVTSVPEAYESLPVQLDPTDPLTRARVRVAGVDGVGTAFRGSDPLDVFPRGFASSLPKPPAQGESDVGIGERAGDSIGYIVFLDLVARTFPVDALTPKQARQFTTATAEVTMRPSDDTDPIEVPPAASILQPGEQPTRPCPASV